MEYPCLAATAAEVGGTPVKLKIAVAGMVLLVGSLAFSMRGQANVAPGFEGGGNPEPICFPLSGCPSVGASGTTDFDSSTERSWQANGSSRALLGKVDFDGNPDPFCFPSHCPSSRPRGNISLDNKTDSLWSARGYSYGRLSKTDFSNDGNPEPLCFPPSSCPFGRAAVNG